MLVVVAKKCAGPAVFELWTLRNFIWVIELKLCWKIWSMFRKGHWVRWQRGRLMPDAQCSQCVVESMHVIVVLVTLSHHDPALWLALWSRQGLVSKPGDLELEQSDSPRFLFETTFFEMVCCNADTQVRACTLANPAIQGEDWTLVQMRSPTTCKISVHCLITHFHFCSWSLVDVVYAF